MSEKRVDGGQRKKKHSRSSFLDIAAEHLSLKTFAEKSGEITWFPWLPDKDYLKCKGILMNKDSVCMKLMLLCLLLKVQNQGWPQTETCKMWLESRFQPQQQRRILVGSRVVL